MKGLFLTLFVFFTLHGFVISQTPTNQDCLGAIAICQTTYSESNAYIGTGNYPNEIDTSKSCLKSGEKNDVWYTFTLQSSGSLCFTITPNLSSDDYDWAVFDLTSANCSDIFSNGALEVSCNYAANPGSTGPNGLGGAQNEACISVSAGDIYVVNVSQFSPSPNGYNIDFSASTATTFDNTTPTIQSVVNTPISCGETSLTFTFSESVLCNTVQDGDFQLSGPGGPYTLSGITGAACSSGGTQEIDFTINVSPAINSGGSFNLCLVAGSGVTDLCGNVAPNACLSFTVTGLTTSTVSTTDVTCFNGSDGTATVVASGGIAPYTYTWVTLPVQTGATATGLSGGIYSYTAADGTGCSGTSTVTIITPTVIPQGFDVTCDSLCDGSASVTPVLGTSPYSYQWYDDVMSPIVGETSSSISNLCAGAWSVVVTDNAGCKDTTTIVIKLPSITISPSLTGCVGYCDGKATVTAIGGVAPYTYEWQNPLGVPIGQNDSILDSVCAGQYYLQVTTGNACILIDSVTVSYPANLTGTITAKKDACFGVCDGTVTVIGSGGTPPYSYTWDDPAIQATATATGLCQGTYTVLLTDSKGCGPDTSSATIGENPLMTSTTSVIHTNCDTVNGSATVNVTGGTTPYSYQWDSPGSPTTANISGLGPGTYTLIVTDSALCNDTSVVNIGYADSNTATITIDSAITCNGGCNGQVSVTVTGGAGNSTVEWNTKETTTTIDSLCPDTFTVTAIDTNGCPAFASIILNEPPPITISATNTNVTCNGGSDGTITIIASGGTGTLNFSIDGGTTFPNTTGIFTDLSGGDYTIVVQDSNGCTLSVSTITITDPPPIIISSEASTDVSCFGGSDGTITIIASGGTGALSYSIDGGATFAYTTGNITGLNTGSYDIGVQDANGCTQNGGTLTINETTPAINIILETTTDASVCGGTDGEITIVANGGTPPLSYSIDGGITFDSIGFFTGLNIGNYQVAIQDALGCIKTGSILTINDPSAIIITTESWTDATGCLVPDGTIIITASDTTGGSLSYSIDGGNTFPNTTGIFTGLSTGTYYVVVQDANLCKKIGSTIIIDDPSTVTGVISSTPDTNNAGVGTAMISSVGGGNSPYTYSWSNGSNSSAATGLITGTYTVTITDASGCTYVDSILVGTYTDIKELANAISQIKIYPNPNKGRFTIEIKSSDVKEMRLKIVNLLGQEVYYEKITVIKGINQETVDLSAYSTGLYNLQLLTGNGIIFSKKIISGK